MAAAPELVPLLGRTVIKALLVPLAALAGYFVAWGLVFCMDAVVRAFFGTAEGAVGWIPFAGKILTSPLKAIEHKLTSFLGGLEAHFDRQMGVRWHALGEVLTRWAHDAEDAAVLSYHLAKRLAALYGDAASGRLGARFQRWVRGELAKLHGVQRVVIHTTKVVAHTTTRVLVPRARAVGGELEHVIEWDLPRLRARTKALEDATTRLWRWIRSHPLALPAAVSAAVVAAVLARLGATWIRCANWNRIGRAGCRLPTQLLEQLLGDAIEAFIVADLCDFIEAASFVAAEFEPVLLAFVDVEDALIGCHGATAPPELGLPALDLPAAPAGLALAA